MTDRSPRGSTAKDLLTKVLDGMLNNRDRITHLEGHKDTGEDGKRAMEILATGDDPLTARISGVIDRERDLRERVVGAGREMGALEVRVSGLTLQVAGLAGDVTTLKRIVYGFVGLVLTGFGAALIALVLK